MPPRTAALATHHVAPLLFGALLPLAAGAQGSPRSANGDSVPRELALALIAPYSGERGAQPEIRVGRAPRWLPANAVPVGRGVVALGALEYKRGPEMPGYGTAVFVVPGPPDSVLDSYERALEGAGWTHAPMGPEGGGFVPAAIQRPAMLCHDSTAIFASAMPRSEGRGGTQLRLTVSSASRGSPCGEQRETLLYRIDGGPPVPELKAPAGVRSRGSSGGTTISRDGNGIESREISSRLTTEMSPAAIAAHYGAQLRTAGWSVQAPPVATTDAAIELFETSDVKGARWRGLLTVISAPGPGQRDVSLRLVRATAIDDD